MDYSVNQLAKIAGITIRTLHYYDEIGLLKPCRIDGNGYRYYGDKELRRLQQILFFRELEFPLEKIKKIMDAPGFDALAALADQQQLLELKKQRTEKLLETIKKTITVLKGGGAMSNDDAFFPFQDPTYQKYKDEVEERWGNTVAYQQSMQRIGKLSKEEWGKIKTEGVEIENELARLMKEGFAANSPEVQEQIGRFYKHLRHFYDPGPEMFKGLGQMYVDDPRFKAHYENLAKGLAGFKREAMKVYADKIK